MSDLNIEDAIANREFELKNGDKVYAYIWLPVLQPTGEYGCCYKILGLGSEKVRVGYGVDSLQALVLTLDGILTHLCLSDEYKIGNLTWYGSQNLGLPVPKYLREDTSED